MTQTEDTATPAATVTESTAEMTRLGITNLPIDRFHYRDYKYTNLGDAIAQAKRDQEKG